MALYHSIIFAKISNVILIHTDILDLNIGVYKSAIIYLSYFKNINFNNYILDSIFYIDYFLVIYMLNFNIIENNRSIIYFNYFKNLNFNNYIFNSIFYIDHFLFIYMLIFDISDYKSAIIYFSYFKNVIFCNNIFNFIFFIYHFLVIFEPNILFPLITLISNLNIYIETCSHKSNYLELCWLVIYITNCNVLCLRLYLNYVSLCITFKYISMNKYYCLHFYELKVKTVYESYILYIYFVKQLFNFQTIEPSTNYYIFRIQARYSLLFYLVIVLNVG